MAKERNIRIELTEDQKQQLREETGEEAEAVELTVEELEDRISPKELNLL